MLLGGLWHGANWTYVVWGGIHGLVLSAERLFNRLRPVAADDGGHPLTSVRGWVARVVIFHVVCFAWVFFRAPSLGEAVIFLRGLGSLVWMPEYAVALRFLALFSVPLFVVDLFNESRGEEYLFETSVEYRRVAVGIAMMTIITLLAANQVNAFIYFRF